jgi:hypothetical protein
MNLLRPTAPPELADDGKQDETPGEPESRGETAEEPKATAKPRRKRSAPLGKTSPRNIHLTDDVYDRLWMLSRQRKTTVSAVANDVLDKNIPRWEVKRVS